jgi:hypothetical protein
VSYSFNYFNHCIALRACCSAYRDWISGPLVLDYLTGSKASGISYKTTADAAVPWPWSSGVAGDTKHRFYGNYIASPVVLTGWATGTPSTTFVTQDIFTGTVSDREFCSGALNGMGAIRSTVSSNTYPISVIPYGATQTDQTGAWGDYYTEALIMEHDIGRDDFILSGVITRHTGKCWTYRWNSTNYNFRVSDGAGVSVSTDSVTGDVTVNLFLSNTDVDFVDSSTNFVVNGAAQMLNLMQVHIASGQPYVYQVNPAQYGIVVDVTIRCWYAGQYAELTGRLHCGQSASTSTAITNIAQWTTISHPGRLYSYPQIFYNLRANIASFASGLLDSSLVDEVVALGQSAWETNRCL